MQLYAQACNRYAVEFMHTSSLQHFSRTSPQEMSIISYKQVNFCPDGGHIHIHIAPENVKLTLFPQPTVDDVECLYSVRSLQTHNYSILLIPSLVHIFMIEICWCCLF